MKVKEFNLKKNYSEASGACAVVDKNIIMKLNEYGFYEEQTRLSDDAELDPLVEFVSPNLNEKIDESKISKNLYGNVEGIKFDNRIGYYTSLYIGHVTEGEFREKASSGGMGTWIFKELFESNLIDGVIHVKKNTDSNDSLLFQYDISRSIEEIKDGAKTKYYPVEFSKVIKTVKDLPGRYAIIGIPSFIMSIRLLAEVDAVIKDRIRFTIGLISGHQKSSKFAEALAWQVGIKPGNLKYIDFRKKLLNKPASMYAIEMIGIIEGKEQTIIRSSEELLGQDWGQGFFKIKGSDFTDDVMNETADITLGDAWLPEYIKDSLGNNIVIVRNPEIDILIKNGIKLGRLNLDIADTETIFLSQAAHYRHTHDELAYRLYKKDKFNEWRPKKRVKASNDFPLFRRKVQDLRETISTNSHKIYKKAVEKNDLKYFEIEMERLSKKYNYLYRIMYIQKSGIEGIFKSIIRKLRSLIKQ